MNRARTINLQRYIRGLHAESDAEPLTRYEPTYSARMQSVMRGSVTRTFNQRAKALFDRIINKKGAP